MPWAIVMGVTPFKEMTGGVLELLLSEEMKLVFLELLPVPKASDLAVSAPEEFQKSAREVLLLRA